MTDCALSTEELIKLIIIIKLQGNERASERLLPVCEMFC